jgi:PAS domain S-box-containing protein
VLGRADTLQDARGGVDGDWGALNPLRWTVVTQMSLVSTSFAVAVLLFIVPFFYFTRLQNPVLFYSLAEMFGVVVALGMFMLTWNARRFIDNDYFVLLGIAYLFVGGCNYFHAISRYGPLQDAGPNVYLQTWLAARCLESISLLVAPLFTVHRLRPGYAFGAFAVGSSLLLASIHFGLFPDCWIPNLGPTRFATFSGCALAIAGLGAIGALSLVRSHFAGDVYNRLILSILFSVAGTLWRAAYTDAEASSSLVVHALKVGSFYLLYRAVIETGLIRPYGVLFRNLTKSNEEVSRREVELRRAYEHLEEALADGKRVEDERKLTIDLLHLINSIRGEANGSVERLMQELTIFLRERLGFEGVGIRYHHGSDYPYLAASGLPAAFLRQENLLHSPRTSGDCAVAGASTPCHDCLCGEVLSRRFDPSLSFFTPQGTFWTDSLSELLASSPEAKALATQQSCFTMGYESVALVPLRLANDTFGLLHFADRRKGRLTPHLVTQVERIADHIAVAVGRLLAEEALRESEDRFRVVVEHSPEAKMIVWQGRIIFRNPEQERLFGPQQEEIAFRDVGQVYPEDQAEFEQFCANMATQGSPRQTVDLRFYLPIPTGEKALHWLHCQTNPIDYRGKKATLVSMVDVTHMKDLERMVATREQLASIGQLAIGIAHEIRNPLSGINLNLSTIEHICQSREGLDAEEKAEFSLLLGQARAASSRIAGVIQRVMDFAKPVPPKLDIIDCNGVVAAAAEFSLPTLRRNNVELQMALEPTEVKCLADFRLLEHVLLNLITNAVEAMQSNTGPKRLRLATAKQDHKVVITVSDSGPGVPAHLRDRIFEPFYTTRRDGHGVGLSFSHRIITDHGGCLSVSASPWGGAEFRIELPVERRTQIQ